MDGSRGSKCPSPFCHCGWFGINCKTSDRMDGHVYIIGCGFYLGQFRKRQSHVYREAGDNDGPRSKQARGLLACMGGPASSLTIHVQKQASYKWVLYLLVMCCLCEQQCEKKEPITSLIIEVFLRFYSNNIILYFMFFSLHFSFLLII